MIDKSQFISGVCDIYDNGKSCNICNAKKEHFEIAEKLNLSYDTSKKCLG